MHFITALALLPLILGAAIPSPTPPCGTHTLPPPSDYSFQNVQIALRKPVSEPDSPPTPDICLHPGGPVEGPSAPSIGLFGGLKVGLVPCAEATYRWSVRNDGKGIVVGNGQDVLWGLNAEKVEVGSDVTIREADQASPNQEWRLVAGNGQLRLGYTEGPLLCLETDEANNSVSVEVCGTDDAQDQAWVVLLMPQPVPRDIAARCPPPV